jgi:hypothetical protein
MNALLDIGTGPQPARTPGGTLNSPAAPAIVEAPANVAFATPKSSFGETLPSKDGPRARSRGSRKSGEGADGEGALTRGISGWLTIVLVLGALVAGFLLGLAFDRM